MRPLIDFMDQKPVWASAILIALALGAIAFAIDGNPNYKPIDFKDVSYDAVVDLLTPVFLIALFLERAVEVFVTTGRKLGRADKEVALEKAKSKIVQIKARVMAFQAQLDAPNASITPPAELQKIHQRIQGVWDLLPEAQRRERTAQGELERYRGKTRRVAFVVAALLGLLVGLAGLRVITPLVRYQPTNWTDFQSFMFHSIDVVFTAGLLAGGASGIHQIIRVFGDFTEKTRKQVQA